MHMAEVIKYQVEEEVEEIIKELRPKLEEEIEQRIGQQIEQKVEQLRNETAQLTKLLLDEGRLEDLRRTTEDKAYLEQLLLEYKDRLETT